MVNGPVGCSRLSVVGLDIQSPTRASRICRAIYDRSATFVRPAETSPPGKNSVRQGGLLRTPQHPPIPARSAYPDDSRPAMFGHAPAWDNVFP